MSKILYNIIFCFILVNSSTALTSQPLKVGIISAFPGEYGALLKHMEEVHSQEKGKRIYHKGKLKGIETILVASRIGKVASAATTAHLLLDYDVNMIILIGVAGSLDASLNVGDIVIADSLIQHDMDARPCCPIYEIPLLKIRSFQTDSFLKNLSTKASQKFINKDLSTSIPLEILNDYHITEPQIRHGLVITGDQVISRNTQKAELRKDLPEALCVEMEGASVGQVCYEYGIPFIVIRIISDYSNHDNVTSVDVRKFIDQISGHYSVGIVNNLYDLLLETP